MEGHGCPYVLSDEKTVFDGRWLKTKEVRFQSKKTKAEGVWQSSHRTTKPVGAEVDGVDIIAVLRKAGKKFFIFVKQYRIPMGGWTLEFPAGLVDVGETAEATALRELKEETGYSASGAKILHRTSGMQGLDPGLSDDSVQFVTVEINGDTPENANPQQRLDSDENIEVVLVECDHVLDYLRSVEKSLHVEAMVYSFAIGYSLSRQFGL